MEETSTIEMKEKIYGFYLKGQRKRRRRKDEVENKGEWGIVGGIYV